MHNTLLKRFLNSRSDNRKSKIENRKWAGLFAIVVALTVCGVRVCRFLYSCETERVKVRYEQTRNPEIKLQCVELAG